MLRTRSVHFRGDLEAATSNLGVFHMSVLRLFIVAVALVALAVGFGANAGCGSDDVSVPGGNATCTGACDCSGDTCKCMAGGKCVFGGGTSSSAGAEGGEGGASADGGSAGPDNVTYNCETKNTCE